VLHFLFSYLTKCVLCFFYFLSSSAAVSCFMASSPEVVIIYCDFSREQKTDKNASSRFRLFVPKMEGMFCIDNSLRYFLNHHILCLSRQAFCFREEIVR
jgi:hypothetical protein